MANQISNDNDKTRAAKTGLTPDPHGQAALLLVESLIHGLLSRSVISVTEAVEIVETAVEVNTEIAAEQAVPHVTTDKSLAMLVAISASLQNDLPETGLS